MATAARSRRYLTLDHWRGVACLSVLVNHSIWTHTGTQAEQLLAEIAQRLWIGVPVFFVISGYCISAAVDGHRQHAGRPIRTYFTRRLRRIYPPYWYVLLSTMLCVALVDVFISGAPLSRSGTFLRPWWYDLRQWFGNLTLTEIWRYHVVPGQRAMILGHAWTLCYEEQFYVVSGLLLWLTPRRYFLGALGVTLAVALTMRAAALANWNIDGFFFDGSWFQFWFGILLYYAVNYARTRARLSILLMFVVVAVLAATDVHRLLVAEKNSAQSFFVAGTFAAIALSVHRYDRALHGMGILRGLRTCGEMCYSLYLVHLPVAKLIEAGFLWGGVEARPLLSMTVTIPTCLLLAWWFHRIVERRFLNSPTHDQPAKGRVDIAIPVPA